MIIVYLRRCFAVLQLLWTFVEGRKGIASITPSLFKKIGVDLPMGCS